MSGGGCQIQSEVPHSLPIVRSAGGQGTRVSEPARRFVNHWITKRTLEGALFESELAAHPLIANRQYPK